MITVYSSLPFNLGVKIDASGLQVLDEQLKRVEDKFLARIEQRLVRGVSKPWYRKERW